MSADARVAAAERALAEHGVHGASVEVEGHEREIAALRVPEGEWERMMGPDGVRLADAVKAAGFRYVALDLLAADAEGAGDAYDAGDLEDEDGPAGWDAFDPPDDASPRVLHPPPTAAESRAEARTLGWLFLGLTAVEVVRAAVIPGASATPLAILGLQWAIAAWAGYAATRGLRHLLRLPFMAPGTYVFAIVAGDTLAGLGGLPVHTAFAPVDALPVGVAALAGGLAALLRRRHATPIHA